MEEITAPYLGGGTKLNNKYSVISPLGEGGTSLIYLVKTLDTGEILAVKEFFPKKFCNRNEKGEMTPNPGREKLIEESHEKFRYEAALLYKNSSVDGMLRVFEIFDERNTTYYVMEYLDGITLSSFLDKQGGRLGWDKTGSLLLPVFNSLISLHRVNIRHRDISPDNIFILKDGKARIIDYGNALEECNGADKKIDWAKKGFSPIELYNSGYDQGPWTDVYALAATLYYCLTGIAPMGSVERQTKEGPLKPSDIGVSISKNVEDAIMKALSLAPKDRFQSLTEFRDEIYRGREISPEGLQTRGEKMVNISQFKEKDRMLYAMVRNFQAGDVNAFNKIYELSEKYIFKIINDILKDVHQTEDVMQETYIQVYTKIGSLQAPEAFYVWAGRIATNFTYRYVQKYRREILAPPSENADDDDSAGFLFDKAAMDNEAFIPENVLMDRTKQKMISDILDSLSTEQKLSVQYYYYEEMSVGEIAQLMGCSAGTVKSRLNYARTAIKKSVLNIERTQDTKLYSFAGVPVLFVIFRYASEELTAINVSSAGILAGVTQALSTPGMAVAGATQKAALGQSVSAGGSVTMTSAAASGTTAATATAVTTAAGSLGVKIAVVALAGVLTIGGSVKSVSDMVTEKRLSAYTYSTASEYTTSQGTVASEQETAQEEIREQYQSVLNRYDELGVDTQAVTEQLYYGSDYRTQAYDALNRYSQAFDSAVDGYRACMSDDQYATAKSLYLDTFDALVANQGVAMEDLITFVENNSDNPDVIQYFNDTIKLLDMTTDVMLQGNTALTNPVSAFLMQNFYTASDVQTCFEQGMNAPDMIITANNQLVDTIPSYIESGYFSENDYNDFYNDVTELRELSTSLLSATEEFSTDLASNTELMTLLSQQTISDETAAYYEQLKNAIQQLSY